jgi:hypothetical protein
MKRKSDVVIAEKSPWAIEKLGKPASSVLVRLGSQGALDNTQLISERQAFFPNSGLPCREVFGIVDAPR